MLEEVQTRLGLLEVDHNGVVLHPHVRIADRRVKIGRVTETEAGNVFKVEPVLPVVLASRPEAFFTTKEKALTWLLEAYEIGIPLEAFLLRKLDTAN